PGLVPWSTWWQRVLDARNAEPGIQVGGAHAACAQPDQHLTRSGCRVWHLDHVECAWTDQLSRPHYPARAPRIRATTDAQSPGRGWRNSRTVGSQGESKSPRRMAACQVLGVLTYGGSARLGRPA